MTLPLEEQMSCVKRELALRARVYPGQVANRRMTQEWADYQIAAMTAVLETLQGLAPEAQPSLFTPEEKAP